MAADRRISATSPPATGAARSLGRQVCLEGAGDGAAPADPPQNRVDGTVSRGGGISRATGGAAPGCEDVILRSRK